MRLYTLPIVLLLGLLVAAAPVPSVNKRDLDTANATLESVRNSGTDAELVENINRFFVDAKDVADLGAMEQIAGDMQDQIKDNNRRRVNTKNTAEWAYSVLRTLLEPH